MEQSEIFIKQLQKQMNYSENSEQSIQLSKLDVGFLLSSGNVSED